VKQEESDVAATFSWDESGSMMGPKIDTVKKLAYTWNEAFGKLNLPLEMLGWTTHPDRGQYDREFPHVYRNGINWHRIYKEFDERWNDSEVMKRLTYIAPVGNTPMGEGLLFAMQRLATRQERRKILFFLTDGYPGIECNGSPEVHVKFIKRLVEKAATMGIELVGVGVQIDISHLFPTSLQINDVSDLRGRLSDELLKILRRTKQEVLTGRS
jgi:cobalamin biosynthesis protein CobT